MHELACGDLARIIDADDLIPVLAIVLGSLTGMVVMVTITLGEIFKTRARESTKRELAAYVAEGTISAEDAVAIAEGRARSPIA